MCGLGILTAAAGRSIRLASTGSSTSSSAGLYATPVTSHPYTPEVFKGPIVVKDLIDNSCLNGKSQRVL